MLLKYCLSLRWKSAAWVVCICSLEHNFSVLVLLTQWQVEQVQDDNLIFQWFSELKKGIHEESRALRKDRAACDMEALTFIPVQTLLQTKKCAVTLHCSVRRILFHLEELNNNSCAVHTSSRTVTHMREIIQGATRTYDPAVLLEGSVYYTILTFMNSKKHGYTSLSTVYFSAHCTSC